MGLWFGDCPECDRRSRLTAYLELLVVFGVITVDEYGLIERSQYFEAFCGCQDDLADCWEMMDE